MKRIGIITYHAVANDGAVLQAYALSQALQARFPQDQVEVVNYRSRSVELGERLKLFKVTPQAPCVRFLRTFRIRRFWQRNLPLSEESLVTDSYEKSIEFLNGRYDVLVVGSDMIWNVNPGLFAQPFPSIFWLSPQLECKKIAYAASADKCNFSKLSEWKRAFARDALEAFDLIGVRDRHTYETVRALNVSNSSSRLFMVPDPTFLHEIRPSRAREKLVETGLDLGRPILALNLFRFGQLCRDICQHYRAKGYQLVSVSQINPKVDVSLVERLTPFEWAEAFRYFTLVMGDRFHGTIMAIKNNTPFVTLELHPAYKGTMSKMRSMLEEMHLSDNIVSGEEIASNVNTLFKRAEQVQAAWSPPKVESQLREMRERGLGFIERVAEVIE